MDVGREIRRLREARGWSQAKLAGATGMGVSGISQIETGARNPSAVTLWKIAGALGVETCQRKLLLIGLPRPFRKPTPLCCDQPRDDADDPDEDGALAH
jgi:transcriptional regulator with XRE-family HTH domain